MEEGGRFESWRAGRSGVADCRTCAHASCVPQALSSQLGVVAQERRVGRGRESSSPPRFGVDSLPPTPYGVPLLTHSRLISTSQDRKAEPSNSLPLQRVPRTTYSDRRTQEATQPRQRTREERRQEAHPQSQACEPFSFLPWRPRADSSSTARTSLPPDPTAFLTQSVATLSRAVRAIQSRPPQATPESLQSLYSLCEGAVAGGAGTGQVLYDRIRMEIERQVGEIRKELHRGEVVQGTEEEWMGLLELEWKRLLEQMLLIRSIFLHLDRTFVLQSAGLLSIW